MGVTKIVIGGTARIDISDTTATPADVAEGVYFYDDQGDKQEGTSTKDSNTTDATAVASEILATRTAYVNKNKITGNMPNNGAVAGTLDDADDVYTVPIGFHDGSGKVQIDPIEKAKLKDPSNIKAGVEIMGTVGEYSGEGATAEAKTVTPTFSQQTVLPTSADYLSQVTVNAIPVTETQTAHGITITVG